MKRISLFLLTNILVVLAIGILSNIILGYFPNLKLDTKSILIFSFVWGMGGAFISLFLSKPLAKRMYNIHKIDFSDPIKEYQMLRLMVNDLSKKAGIKPPEIIIYDSDEVNAFATGASKNNALVAFSWGLLHHMNMDEIEGVVAHEISHIANGDMVTMALLQGVVNSFVIFFARIAARAFLGDKLEGLSNLVYYFVASILESLFMAFGFVIISSFSRSREYKADEGAAELVGAYKIVAALEKLQNIEPDNSLFLDQNLKNFKIFGKRNLFSFLFATHPPIEKRIDYLMGIYA